MARWWQAVAALTASAAARDWRKLDNGNLMYQDAYLDQPYCVTWPVDAPTRIVCTIASNANGSEGKPDEHSEILYSDDGAKTWTTGIRLEALGEPTNSYGVIGITDFSRIWVAYNFNADNVTTLNGQTIRNDELGYFYMRYSDDGGETWSPDRYLIPTRNTTVDANNSFGGKVQMMWSVDHVKTRRGLPGDDGRTYHAYTKIGTMMQLAPEETFIVSSPNIRSERNISLVTWDLFPNGDHGVQAPPRVATTLQWEEAHTVLLRNSSGQFSWTRTNAGYMGAASTTDPTGASGWSEGHFMTYSSVGLPAAAGRLVKNPEGPTAMKYFDSLGCYLMLYYYNSFPGYAPPPGVGHGSRNPYWLAAGWEVGGEVVLSQPEVVLYDAALLYTMPGYPDFVEFGPTLFITETNKTHARAHPLDATFLSLLASQRSVATLATAGVTHTFNASSQGATFGAPPLPDFATADSVPGAGLTVGLWVSQHAAACAGTRTEPCPLVDLAPGFSLAAQPGSLAVTLTVGGPNGTYPPAARAAAPQVSANVTTDAECTARLLSGGGATPHYLAAVVDAGAHILSLSVDGVVCDGAAALPWGFAHVPADMGATATNAPSGFVLGAGYGGSILGGNIWARYLLNSEVVGNFRAGLAAATAAAQ